MVIFDILNGMESFGSQLNQSQKRPARSGSHKVQSFSTKELTALPRPERDRVITESAHEIISELRATGAIEYTNMSEMYGILGNMDILTRRESPDRILEALATNTSILIDFPDDKRYSNAVLWNSTLGSRGLENAYLEGYGQFNSIVSVIGFRVDEKVDIENLPDASQQFAGLDRAYVRSIRGSIDPDNLLFVSVRIPIFAFPENEMTQEELERRDAYFENPKASPAFIHRGFLFTDHLKKQ